MDASGVWVDSSGGDVCGAHGINVPHWPAEWVSCDGCNRAAHVDAWATWCGECGSCEDHCTCEDARKRERMEAATASGHMVTDDAGNVRGYFTRLGGLYVCIECGHLCECGEDSDE